MVAGAQDVARDLRVCAIGDSFVAGVGDPEHRGWVGRLASGSAVTLYNLGVRRDTSADVLARWSAECGPRLPPGCVGRVLVAFGVNDMTADGDGTRVPAGESVANLEVLLREVAAAGHGVLVVGPPPVGDAAQNVRIAELGRAFADVCTAAGVPVVPVFDALRADATWMTEVMGGDGSHPGARGYERLAELVRPAWNRWLRS